MKRKSQTEKKYPADEVKRYLGALQEENRDHYKAIGERLDGVQATLDSHTEILDSHTEMLDSHTEILDSHTEMIGGVATRLSHVEITMEVMKQDVEFIKSGLKRKVDQDEFDALIRRVSVLEKRVLK